MPLRSLAVDFNAASDFAVLETDFGDRLDP
jgi:hypothetical protein